VIPSVTTWRVKLEQYADVRVLGKVEIIPKTERVAPEGTLKLTSEYFTLLIGRVMSKITG